MTDFYIGQGDTASALSDVLRDAAGEPVDLAGASVKVRLVPLKGGEPLLDSVEAENDQVGDGSDGSKGAVHRDWTDGETDAPGDFLGQWIVTFAGGEVQTYPNAGYLLITITPDPAVLPGRYFTLEEWKRTHKMEGRNFADRDIEVAIAAIADALDEEYGGPWTLGPSDEVRYFTPVEGKTTIRLRPPVVTLGEVALDTAGGGTYSSTLEEDVDFRLEENGSLLRFLRSGSPWSWEYPSPGSGYAPFGRDALRITGQFGWTEAPAGVKAAATILTTRLVRRMRDAPFPIIGFGADGATQWAGSAVKDPDVVFAMRGAKPRKLRTFIV